MERLLVFADFDWLDKPELYGAQNEAYKCQLIGKASNNLCLS